jgi:hypothetical protein
MLIIVNLTIDLDLMLYHNGTILKTLYCEVTITDTIYGFKFHVRFKIYPHMALSYPTSNWDNNRMFNNANVAHPNSPLKMLILRNISEHIYNNED